MEDEKIIIKIPSPPITSLIFEGGGVKGIAYAGAYKALTKQKGLLDKLHWVAGSSAGAMTALLVSLNFTPDEIEDELSAVNFSEFAEALPDGKLAIINYIFKNMRKISNNINHGINDGKKLYYWAQRIVEKKLGNKEATFLDLKNKNAIDSENFDVLSHQECMFKNLIVVVTNAFKNKSEIFSWETTPHLKIADAVLASMSIPGYFYVRYIDSKKTAIDWSPTREKITSGQIIPYVDGGVLNNYPINIFREYKYWLPEYYGLVKSHHYNPSSLGIRVDSKEEVLNLIDMRHHQSIIDQPADIELQHASRTFSISNWFINPSQLKGMAQKFSTLLTSDLDKVEQFSPRTIAIIDCGILTTQFNLSEIEKQQLIESGEMSVKRYCKDFLKNETFKVIVYNNTTELQKDLFAKKQLVEIFKNLTDKHTHERELMRLELEIKLSEETLLKLGQKAFSSSFFQIPLASTSKIDTQIIYEEKITDEQKLKKKIEEVPEIETAIVQSDKPPVATQKDNDVVLKLDVEEDDEKQVPLRRRLLCCS